MWECVDLFRAGGGALGSRRVTGHRHRRAGLLRLGRRQHPPPAVLDRPLRGRHVHPAALHRLDYGGRYFYAPQSFADEHGRRIMFGWLQEGRTDDAMVEAGWSGVMCLPRVATLDAEGSWLSHLCRKWSRSAATTSGSAPGLLA